MWFELGFGCLLSARCSPTNSNSNREPELKVQVQVQVCVGVGVGVGGERMQLVAIT